jgi:hypothetical protein
MVTNQPEKTEDDLTIRIRDLRKEIKKKVENELLQQYNKAQTEGKYPWEGMWLKPHDIEKIQKIMKKKDRIVFAEIIALFLLMALFSCGAYIFIIAVLPG